MQSELMRPARAVLEAAKRYNLSIVTAESCTAGKLAALLSEAPGAAEYLHGGFVAYTKASKSKVLGVSPALLETKGAVCSDVAAAMAQGALSRSPADAAVAITGVAGPDPDEDGNPVGRVCIAIARSARAPVTIEKHYGDLGRADIQNHAMAEALHELIRALEDDASAALRRAAS